MKAEEQEKLIDAMAVAISNAPYPTAQSRAKARRALTAIRDAGYWLAPDEPTEEAFQALLAVCPIQFREGDVLAFRQAFARDYRALRDASPLTIEREG